MRIIPWESVSVGDTIKATHHDSSREIITSIQGIVGYVRDEGFLRTYFTPRDIKLFSQTIKGSFNVVIELIARPNPQQPKLFEE